MDIPWKDQYKHPLWQKKRLEALEAAEYSCQKCCDGENQLHVHHRRYIKGRAVWEYSLEELDVLCECCHLVAHEEKEILNSLLARLHPSAADDIIGLLAGYCDSVSGPCSLDLSADPDLKINDRCFVLGWAAATIESFSPENVKRVTNLLFEILDEKRVK